MGDQFLEMFHGTTGLLVTVSDEQGLVRLDFERGDTIWQWARNELDPNCALVSNMVPIKVISEVEAEWGHLAPAVKARLEIATRRKN